MTKKITIAFALVMAFSGNVLASTSFDGSSKLIVASNSDGSADVIEAYGGTRNGGDC